jgi:hypothetical protein
MTGRVEALRQRAHLVEDRAKPLRDHLGRLVTCSRGWWCPDQVRTLISTTG